MGRSRAKSAGDDSLINYHFDYVIAPLETATLPVALKKSGCSEEVITKELANIERLVRQNSSSHLSTYHSQKQKNDADTEYCLPILAHPYILEVMTASTSGSNTENQTDIRSAFRQALLKNSHVSPGINKRQVWGRMVTQLFAKAALAQTWDGEAIWILQDELLKNMEQTTRLRTNTLQQNTSRNLRLAVLGYKSVPVTPLDTIPATPPAMTFLRYIEGDAGLDFVGNDTFSDLLLPKTRPSKVELFRALLRRPLRALLELPE